MIELIRTQVAQGILTSLDCEGVKAIIPHREPMLLVDGISEIESGKRAKGWMDVAQHMELLVGHFPYYPVVPAILLAEACNQVGAVALLGQEKYHGKLALLTEFDGWKFRHRARPGDILIIEAFLDKQRGDYGRGHGVMTLNNELVTSGRVSFAIVDMPQEMQNP